MKALIIIGAVSLLWFGSIAMGAFQVTALNTPESRSNAVVFLTSNGCFPSGIAAMVRAMEHYYADSTTATAANMTFPGGTKRYDTSKDFFDSLTCHPAQIGHDFEINCFTFVTFLLEDHFHADLLPDDFEAIFLAPFNTSETDTRYMPMPTPRSAFMTSCYDWYLAAVTSITGRAYSDRQISINASLYSMTPYPWTNDNDPSHAKQLLLGRWRGQRFALPESPSVVLMHEAWKDTGIMCTVHAGILFQRKESYTYFEKCGGRGPFLRFDGDNVSDISDYYRRLGSFDPNTNKWRFISIGTNVFEELPQQSGPAYPPQGVGSADP